MCPIRIVVSRRMPYPVPITNPFSASLSTTGPECIPTGSVIVLTVGERSPARGSMAMARPSPRHESTHRSVAASIAA